MADGVGAPEIEAPKRKKFSYLGAPACFVLEEACQFLNRAFDGQCYLVGSVLERPDFRDVDIRFIMDDVDFEALFPDVANIETGCWEFDPRWIVLTTAISQQLAAKTGFLIDFQFQPRTFANKRHGKDQKKARQALGLRYVRKRDMRDDD